MNCCILLRKIRTWADAVSIAKSASASVGLTPFEMCIRDRISEIDALEVDGQIVKRAQEGNAANKIHNDLAERISDRLVGFSESDQQEGAKRSYFPSGEQPNQIIKEDDAVHCGKKHKHQSKEGRPTIRLFGIGMMDAEIEMCIRDRNSK